MTTTAQMMADAIDINTRCCGRDCTDCPRKVSTELRRLDAENQRQRADLERKSEAIQRLWAERDQLRAQVERLQSQPAAWECFLDPSYFDMWAVKRKDSRSFQDAFHVTSEVEAQRLCGLLNGIRQPAAPAMVPLLAESDLK